MSRRFRISILLSALLAWMTIDLACGATWRPSLLEQCGEPASTRSGCCDQDRPKDACPADACALTCAALLTAQISEATISILPDGTQHRIALRNECATATRAAPPVPPPRG
jgi:hypothetical protein